MQLKVLYILEDLTQSGTFNTIIKERILVVYKHLSSTLNSLLPISTPYGNRGKEKLPYSLKKP